MTGASPGRVIRWILGLQMLIGVALVAGDMSTGLRMPGLGPSAPAMDQPVRPGDQTRRYRPGDLPDRPGRPFPATTDMPARLTLTDAELAGREVLRLVGTIAPGDGARIADLLRARVEDGGALPPVLLHSPGGSVTDALDLGRALREIGAETEVVAGDVCLSACPYVLASGTERRVDSEGSVGVHQHYFGENSVQPAFMAVKDIQRGQGQVMAYLEEMGIDPMMLQPALMTPPEDIYIFVTEELERYGLITGDEAA